MPLVETKPVRRRTRRQRPAPPDPTGRCGPAGTGTPLEHDRTLGAHAGAGVDVRAWTGQPAAQRPTTARTRHSETLTERGQVGRLSAGPPSATAAPQSLAQSPAVALPFTSASRRRCANLTSLRSMSSASPTQIERCDHRASIEEPGRLTSKDWGTTRRQVGVVDRWHPGL
jgi:hypothetical protein